MKQQELIEFLGVARAAGTYIANAARAGGRAAKRNPFAFVYGASLLGGKPKPQKKPTDTVSHTATGHRLTATT